MNRQRTRNTLGFTLMEVLIVVAIVGVLVGVSLPQVGNFIDQARRSHDIAMVETAVAAAKAEFDDQKYDEPGSLETYAFDASTGEADTLDPSSGYGQWDNEANYSVDGIAVTGIAKDNFVSCVIIDGEVTRVQWGSLTPGALYKHGFELYADQSVELTSNTSRERLLIDVDTIRAMANEYLGLTKSEILEKTGLPEAYQGRLSNNEGVTLFTYQNRGRSNALVRGDATLLRELGFEGIVGTPGSNSFSNSSTRVFFSDFIDSGVEVNIKIGKVEYSDDGETKTAKRIKAWVEIYKPQPTDPAVPAELSNIYVEL